MDLAKNELRDEALARRRDQVDKESLSRDILANLFACEEFQRADTVLMYIDVRTEVRTRSTLPDLLQSSKQIVVPYCLDNDLQLFRLRDLDELERGAFGILEPKQALRAGSTISPESVDLAILPGVAFSETGVRLGHGHGYYDRLLARCPLPPRESV